jgi:hypothetical protein
MLKVIEEFRQKTFLIFSEKFYVNVITLKKNPPYAHEARVLIVILEGAIIFFTKILPIR